MSDPTLWRSRWTTAVGHAAGVVLLSLIYLISELSVWGLSLLLASARLQYFASIMGMLLVLSFMTVTNKVLRCCDKVYRRIIKAKVDFTNAQLGIGFSVPIIMLNHAIDIRDIGYIIATSVVTNLLSWVAVFFLSLAGLVGILAFQACASRYIHWRDHPRTSSFLPQCEDKEVAQLTTDQAYTGHWQYSKQSNTTADTEILVSSSGNADEDNGKADPITSVSQDKSMWYLLVTHGYILICLIGITAIGIPLELKLHDSRALDWFSLWLCWIVSVRLQRMIKSARLLTMAVRWRHALATMMNPVLVTTLLMLGYTRIRGALRDGHGVRNVLEKFSSGSPLYSIWTAKLSGSALPDNLQTWFGAGDLALSILECGIVTWGFKLYECRKQLFSIFGVCISLFCIVAAAGNVFLSVLLARLIGLDQSQVLAFAARSTTLALAKPAVKRLGGDIALNATLVVSNGILGQLLYPFVLAKLEVPFFEHSSHSQSGDKVERPDDCDNPITVAAGTAIGINGAAMGVSYLYEVQSRAAPYAALSMTMFGIMTVVFTTLEPFTTAVLDLSSS